MMQNLTLLTMHAADVVPTATAPTQPDGFKKVGDQPQLQSGGVLMVEAYAVLWVILFVFVVLAWTRTRGLSAKVDALEAAIAKADRQKLAPTGEKSPSKSA